MFLSWNDSRRSRSLSQELKIPLVLVVAEMEGPARHAVGALKTLGCLLSRRPKLVWYQYSLALGFLLALYSKLAVGSRPRVVADLHTKALKREGPALFRSIILAAKRWSLRACVATIVTNGENRAYARERFGVDPMILPDPLPRMPAGSPREQGRRAADVSFICSFDVDEPIALILDLCTRLSKKYAVAITGNPRRLEPDIRTRLEAVATLTGFVPEGEYWELLCRTRCIVVLSQDVACLPCGAYEAIVVGRRPVIVRDSEAIGVFGECAVYSALDAADLERTIVAVLEDEKSASRDPTLAVRYASHWARHWRPVADVLGTSPLPAGRGRADPPGR